MTIQEIRARLGKYPIGKWVSYKTVRPGLRETGVAQQLRDMAHNGEIELEMRVAKPLTGCARRAAGRTDPLRRHQPIHKIKIIKLRTEVEHGLEIKRIGKAFHRGGLFVPNLTVGGFNTAPR